MDDEFKLNDDTMRQLEVLAHAPGELRFRMQLVYAIKDIRKDIRAGSTDIIARIDRAEKAILGPGKVTHIVKTEMKGDPRLGKLETDVKRLWWLVGLLTAAIVGLAITKVLK